MSVLLVTLLALLSPSDAGFWTLVTVSGTCSVFPLMIKSAKTSIKLVLTLAYDIPALKLYSELDGDFSEAVLLSWWDKRYESDFVVLQDARIVVFPATGVEQKLPFALFTLASDCTVGSLDACFPFYPETLATR